MIEILTFPKKNYIHLLLDFNNRFFSQLSLLKFIIFKLFHITQKMIIINSNRET